MSEFEPLIEESIEVDAPQVKVWALVSDLPRLAEWSPQVVRTIVRGGPIQLGTSMVNINRQGLKVWPTRTKVVRFEPHDEIAFRVKDNYTIWSFSLEATSSGATRITQRRAAPDGLSSISMKLTEKVLGGQQAFTAELRAGMRQTLERIKAEAESAMAGTR